jgi:hypothetical protein
MLFLRGNGEIVERWGVPGKEFYELTANPFDCVSGLRSLLGLIRSGHGVLT